MIRRVEGRRLAYYGSAASENYWREQWDAILSKKYFRDAEAGRLGWFEEPFTRYLPKKGKILEAGCGTGQYVLALQKRGYAIEGIEWSKKTVRIVKKMLPKLPVLVGDVTRIPVNDGYYSGYISLGVIEHRRLGPKPFLRESWRVLRPGGIALIAVPHFNLLRRIKAILGFYARNIPKSLHFYQYAYSETDLDETLRRVGFTILGHFRYDGFKGLKDEIELFRSLVAPFFLQQKRKSHRIGRSITGENNNARSRVLMLLDFVFGHMTMAVCRKPL